MLTLKYNLLKKKIRIYCTKKKKMPPKKKNIYTHALDNSST